MSKSGFKLAFKSPLHRKAAAMALLGITLLIGFLAPRVVYAAAKPNSSAAQANPAQPNAIDSSPDSFYDPSLDRENQNFAAQPDPAAEAVDLLTRALKNRIG